MSDTDTTDDWLLELLANTADEATAEIADLAAKRDEARAAATVALKAAQQALRAATEAAEAAHDALDCYTDERVTAGRIASALDDACRSVECIAEALGN